MNLADEIEDMVSLRAGRTGVDNTIFISTGGYGRHARIKIAVDPPNAFTATGKTVAMTIHDCRIIGGTLAPSVALQAQRFIERNRIVLLDYWDGRIDTEQLIERLV